MKDNSIRFKYIDLLRCLAVYFVILLHCIAPYLNTQTLLGTKTWWACNILNSLCKTGVPLFFMISGALLLSGDPDEDLQHFYQKRFLKLASPFLFWDILYFLISTLSQGRPLDLHLFFSQLVFRGSEYHLWFVYQIAAIYLFLPFLRKAVAHCTDKQIGFLTFITILPSTLFRFLNLIQSYIYISPFNNVLEGYLGFFFLGFLLHTAALTSGQKKGIYLLGILGALGGIWGNWYFSSFGTLNLVFDEGYSLVQFLTSTAIFLFCKEHFSAVSTPFPGFLASFSFGIYLSHVLVLNLFQKYISPLLGTDSLGLLILCAFLFTSLFSTALIALFSKTPFLKRVI